MRHGPEFLDYLCQVARNPDFSFAPANHRTIRLEVEKYDKFEKIKAEGVAYVAYLDERFGDLQLDEQSEAKLSLVLAITRDALVSQKSGSDDEEEEEEEPDEEEEDQSDDEEDSGEGKVLKMVDGAKEDLTYISQIIGWKGRMVERYAFAKRTEAALVKTRDSITGVLVWFRDRIKTILSFFQISKLLVAIMWLQKRSVIFRVVFKSAFTILWIVFFPILSIVLMVLRVQSNPASIFKPILEFLDIPPEWLE